MAVVNKKSNFIKKDKLNDSDTTEEPPSDQLINKPEDLLKYLKKGCKKISEFKIGLEAEKSGIYLDTLKPVQYSGPKGYNAILKKFNEELGWEVIKNQ